MGELTGRVINPGDPGWDAARYGFAARYDYDANLPLAVVFCQDAEDVANAVRWARQKGVPVRARCGRHNYQAYSSLVQGGIIIDVGEMDHVRIDRDKGLVNAGAGLDMITFTELLSESGVTIPLATGASVGLAGLTLGGGFGVTTRLFGLAIDNLVELKVVTADGKVKIANQHENPDLFWACRGGGGGNFGIATEFTFRTHPIGLVAAFNITWSWDQFDQVVQLWQEWSPSVDFGITSLLSLTVSPSITMLGQYTAPVTDLPKISQLLAPILSQTAPTSVNIQIAPHVAAAAMFFGVDPTKPTWAVRAHSDRQIFKSSSAFALEPFSPETIQVMREGLESCPKLSAPPSQPSMIQLLSGGGAPSLIAPDATAAYARKTQFVVQYDGYWTAPQDGPPTIAWAEGLRNTLSPYTVGAYVNYSDDQIPNYLDEYYGPNLARLIQVKKQYDPDNFFRFPQSIPVA